MPLSLPFLDYLVPEKYENKIKIGQLVKIPLRAQEEFGIILSTEPSRAPRTKIKLVKEIVFEEPLLCQEQLNFLIDISEFYRAHLGFLLKSNLIPLQKRKLKNISLLKHTDTFLPDKPKKPVVFTYKNETEKKEFILKKISKKNGQFLILVPELAAIKKTIDLLPENTSNRLVVIGGESGEKESFSKWLQIWRGEKDIVIGTRAALFLPWFNLKNIVLTDDGNPNYKSWDMAPRFHTRDAALFLSKHHGAELSLVSHTLSVESYYFAKNKVYDINGDLKIKSLNKTAEIINMKSERRGGNYSLISIDALNELKKAKTGDVIFFLNRRGTASYVGCRDCGNVLKCPNCKLSLTFHQSKNALNCHYCKFNEPMPAVCKMCGGTNVAMFGAGTQLAEELIKKITVKTSETRPIIRIDSDKNDLEKLDNERSKIIICTQLALPHLNWDKIKLFVFLDADAPIFIPEYKIIENLWQQLRDAQYKLPIESVLLIQTGHPEHLVFKSLYDPENFYAAQLSERRVLGYPPFKYLLKLLIGNAKTALAEKEAAKTYNDLLGLTKTNFGIKILGPFETSPHYYGGQHWQVILAKINYESYKQNTKLLLARVPENWKIDPNPNSLLCFY